MKQNMKHGLNVIVFLWGHKVEPSHFSQDNQESSSSSSCSGGSPVLAWCEDHRRGVRRLPAAPPLPDGVQHRERLLLHRPGSALGHHLLQNIQRHPAGHPEVRRGTPVQVSGGGGKRSVSIWWFRLCWQESYVSWDGLWSLTIYLIFFHLILVRTHYDMQVFLEHPTSSHNFLYNLSKNNYLYQ